MRISDWSSDVCSSDLKERFRDDHATGGGHDAHHDGHGAHEPHESPWVVTVPLVLLAIASIGVGFFTAGPMLFGTDVMGDVKQLPFFLGAIDVAGPRDVVAVIGDSLWHGPVKFAQHGFMAPAFWLAAAGFVVATVMYLLKPDLPAKVAQIGRASCRGRGCRCG